MSPLKILKGWFARVGEWWAGQETALAPDAPCQLTDVWILVGYDPATGRTWGLPDIAALGERGQKDIRERCLLVLATLAPSRGKAPVMSEAEIAALRADIARLYPES